MRNYGMTFEIVEIVQLIFIQDFIRMRNVVQCLLLFYIWLILNQFQFKFNYLNYFEFSFFFILSPKMEGNEKMMRETFMNLFFFIFFDL